jgi:hypothetical protein
VWLNYTFEPPRIEEDAPEGGNMDAGALKKLLAQRHLSQVRRAAGSLYHGQGMRQLRETIEREVAKEHLKVRTDREIHKDLGLRQTLHALLFAYNPSWLRVGLEAVFGESINVATTYTNTHPTLKPKSKAEAEGGDDEATAASKTTSATGGTNSTNSTNSTGGSSVSQATALRRFVAAKLLDDQETHRRHHHKRHGVYGEAFYSDLKKHTLQVRPPL